MLALGTIAVVVSGCSQQPSAMPAPSASLPAPATSAARPLPADPQPTGAGPCPYLDTSFVADANGQRVLRVQTSADKPHPACFFYAATGQLQLRAWVYAGDPVVATALVDRAAPVNTSNPATDPPGWQGGYEQTDNGAVYAVAKAGTAVIVTTDQKQTIKARTVTKQAITALGL
jgi:hypothetical protein